VGKRILNLEDDHRPRCREETEWRIEQGGNRSSVETQFALGLRSGDKGIGIIQIANLPGRYSTPSIEEVREVPARSGRNDYACHGAHDDQQRKKNSKPTI